MNVVVVNPSLFAPYYDYHLCRAVADLGLTVTMVGRPLRQNEQPPEGSFAYSALFYRRTDRGEAGRRTSKLSRILKGFEHAAGLVALENLVVQEHADVVHFQWLVLPFIDRIWLGRLRRRCGLVLTVHNAEIVTHNSRAVIGRLGAIVHSLGQRSAVLSFDRYIVHSTQTFNRLRGLGIAAERIVRLQHPPLDLNLARKNQARSVATERHEILFFGSIKPYKGVDVLIEAGISMAAKRRDFRITIAGQPFQSLDELRLRIANSGAEDVFRFDLNYVSDEKLADYLAEARIVVFPYREIDGSGALSHAVRFQKPIVASKVGGFAESPFAEHLSLVPPDDAIALTATLSELLDEPTRLDELERKSALLLNLLPSWNDYAQACNAVYQAIAPNRVES